MYEIGIKVLDLPEVKALLDQARTQCEQVQSQLPRWIPVSERLPEPDTRVLVFDPSIPEFPRNETHTVIGSFRGLNHFSGQDWYVPDGRGDVTHWMPLPEGPA